MTFPVRSAVLVPVLALVASGCASIVGGTAQVISVETASAGQAVSGAGCTLKNPKGEYFVTTPGTLTVNRAYDDLVVKCTKDGYVPGMASAKSTTKGMAFGNVIFGGVIGGAVDISTGAAYDYPSLITVQMRSVASGAQPTGPAPVQTPADAPAVAPSSAASGTQGGGSQSADAAADAQASR